MATVSVMRDPSMHPGNLRKLQAVAPPDVFPLAEVLRARGEIAVFSVQGDRSELDRMSGGDFDGDTVRICWDQSMLPPKMYDPPAYGGAPSQPVLREGTDATAATDYNIGERSARYLPRVVCNKVALIHRAWMQLADSGAKTFFTTDFEQIHQL